MTEKEFYKMIHTMLEESRITKEEHDKMENFVCGIFDFLSLEWGIHNEDDF